MKPYDYQIEKAKQAFSILKQKGYCYIFGEPRTGKTYTAILTAEMSEKIKNVMVLTKKKAIPGWQKFTKLPHLKKNYTVINYEQLGKYNNGKIILNYNPKDYQLLIVDESHNIGRVGKPSQRFQIIRAFAWNLPHLHLSGTPIVETALSIYYQMAISKYNPFKYPNFYKFFEVYGIPSVIRVGGRYINEYKKFDKKLLDEIAKFTITITQDEVGIKQKALDKIHFIELDNQTKKWYNSLQTDRYLYIPKALNLKTNSYEPLELVADSIMKLRLLLHQLEGGTVKVEDDYYWLGNLEKIKYIQKTFGDSEDIGIMAHFIGEQILLKKYFRKAKIYSSSAHAEGVDLSHLRHFIIYSSDYSGAKFIQRRDRIINTKGSNTTIVNHLLVKKAISHQVYKVVSKKKDFNNSTFEIVNL